ncbi:MAG: type I glyceraldehyde-3-phosphate dehydrogenase [Bdellovibrionales bacterium]|nr:type I glyceraldehyde-3-phosphate dehydrogenase [Bdellovibrionales bacterium]
MGNQGTIKYAINGFGRIGRNVVRAALKANAQGGRGVELVAVNDLTDSTTLAHLLKYDSIHGRFPAEVEAADKALKIAGKTVKVFSEKDPSKLPWGELGVDIVLECTGIFRDKAKASMHLTAGAKKVVISAPSPDPDLTVVMGVNHGQFNAAEHTIISNGSCTTNALAPVAKVLLENFGIEGGLMTTIHSYTNDQAILDLPHKDLRRARAAAMSMIPTSTGAASAIGEVIPQLKGKLDGLAIRVPTPDVSLVDLVVTLERDATAEDINKALVTAANGQLQGILAVSDEPLVSTDFIGSPASSTVDLENTAVIGKRLAKVLAWYDNEMGFSYRMVDVMKLIS